MAETSSPSLADWPLFLIAWFPHSGCRWLARGLLKRHRDIEMGEFFCPWLHRSTDDVLKTDATTQVHKSRSLPELAGEFAIAREAVEAGRRAGIAHYFEAKRQAMQAAAPNALHGGVLPCGSDIGFLDLPALIDLMPNGLKIVHLVRDPRGCYPSFATRAELDGSPERVAGLWSGFNAWIRASAAPLGDARYRVIRYEDLTADPHRTLAGLVDWLGLPPDPACEEGIAEYHGRNRDVDLSHLVNEDVARRLLAVSAAELAQYGGPAEDRPSRSRAA